MTEKILVNKIQCKLCDDIIESMYGDDFKMCKCEACAVDGGKGYLRRLGDPDQYLELSEKEIIRPKKIKHNKIMCNVCKDIIESSHVHEYRRCKCGKCSVDGGNEYLKRSGHRLLYTELSEYE